MREHRYAVEPISPFRQLVIDGMDLAAQKHTIHGLVEVDISSARERLREIKEDAGEALSFTGFIVYCCARAVEEDKHLHAYRDWRNRLILFDDVDVSLPVERVEDGRPVVLQTVIRAANRKTVREIHKEIRNLQSKELAATPWGAGLRWYVLVPAFIRRWFFRLAARAPHVLKRFNGTVLVTSVGMYGTTAGWGIPLPGHTLSVTIGGVEAKPTLREGRLEARDHLCLTVSFDHDVVDGGPAARFIRRFQDLLQSAAGLSEEKPGGG
jgi:pyruvate/2-oxoglutarate dehydrogenase complex dihydrolipoamide acyltransferase (E2) component